MTLGAALAKSKTESVFTGKTPFDGLDTYLGKSSDMRHVCCHTLRRN
jgi:hypothetical protein